MTKTKTHLLAIFFFSVALAIYVSPLSQGSGLFLFLGVVFEAAAWLLGCSGRDRSVIAKGPPVED